MILVVGAGVAGLSCALAAAARGAEVELVTPGRLAPDESALAQAPVLAPGCGVGPSAVEGHAAVRALRDIAGGNTALAQGGIAAAIGADDSPADHLADTLGAGGGLVDPDAAGVLTRDGARIVRRLLAEGLPVDRDATGAPLLALEGAHGRPRIFHAGGDRSGAVLHACLAARVLREVAAGRVRLTEETRAEELLLDSGAVVGAVLVGGAHPSGLLRREERRATAVVLATGGYAAMYSRTTNRAEARGEGILLAARAGALVADLEFVQFHPTALPTGELVSEAVRGAGAVLRDASGARIMAGRHPLADLAPRDVVSRELHGILRERGDAEVFLDATGIERERGAGALARAFPGISAAVAALGYDWATEPIPVAPAAHYSMGGVASDLDGRTSVPGLFVAGEVASTGVHGANRLASNSLLEGLVFGERAGIAAAVRGVSGDWPALPAADALDIATVASPPHPTPALRAAGSGIDSGIDSGIGSGIDAGAGVGVGVGAFVGGGDASRTATAAHPAAVSARAGSSEVTAAIDSCLGIVRDGADLRRAAAVFADASGDAAALGALVCAAAEERRESRGAHARADHPDTDPAQARRRAFRLGAVRAADHRVTTAA